MGGFHYQQDADNIVTVTMDMDGQVNLMNGDYASFMEKTVTRLESESESISGVIFTSAKETFFAGGDLKRIYDLRPSQSEEFFAGVEWKKSLLRRLEKLGKPVVAAINGSALGAGLEICLACSHRIAIDTPTTLLGLPEVTLGLLPGAGGVVRSLHMLGLKQALPLLLTGTCVTPDKAQEVGLVDQLASDVDEMLVKARSWIKENPLVSKPWDQKGYKLADGGANDPRVRRFFAGSVPQMRKQSKERQFAAETILDVAADATRVNFDTALRIESRGLTALVMTSQAKGMIAFNFLQAKKDRAVSCDSYVSRLSDALQDEANRLFDEGISPVLINAVARQSGITLTPSLADSQGRTGVAINQEDVRDRLLFSQVLEAVRCLEQGVIDAIPAGNFDSVKGAGFPASLGGVFQCIDAYGFNPTSDEIGAAAFVRRASQMSSQYGERFTPPVLLQQKAASNARFW